MLSFRLKVLHPLEDLQTRRAVLTPHPKTKPSPSANRKRGFFNVIKATDLDMRLNFVLQEFFGLCAHYFANFPSYTRPDGSVAITRYRPLGSEETSIPPEDGFKIVWWLMARPSRSEMRTLSTGSSEAVFKDTN